MSGIFKSIGSLFAPSQQVTQQPSTATSNPTVPSSTTVQSDGSVPAIPVAGVGDKSPLDGYNDLWQAPKDPATPASLVPTMNADPNQIRAAAKNADFTKQFDPQLIQKALKGDEAAFGQALNQAVQTAFAASAEATAGIVRDALTKQEKIFNEQIMPQKLREHSVSQQVRQDNPIFDKPAIAPLLKAVEQQLMAKHPTASPQEISNHAKAYLEGFSQEMVSASGSSIVKNPTQDSSKGGSEDWEKYFA